MADQTQVHHHRHDQQQQQLQQKGEQAVQSFKNFLQEKSPSTPQILAVITVLPLGAFLLFLSGLALTGSVIGLGLSIPVFLLFSPVIIPAALVIGLAVTGFLASGAFGITGLSAFSWIINYFRSGRAIGGVEHIIQRAHETAGQVGQKVKETGQDVTGKAREAGRST